MIKNDVQILIKNKGSRMRKFVNKGDPRNPRTSTPLERQWFHSIVHFGWARQSDLVSKLAWKTSLSYWSFSIYQSNLDQLMRSNNSEAKQPLKRCQRFFRCMGDFKPTSGFIWCQQRLVSRILCIRVNYAVFVIPEHSWGSNFRGKIFYLCLVVNICNKENI